MLSDYLTKHHLLSEILGSHLDGALRAGVRAAAKDQKRGYTAKILRSSHPSPPSAASAIRADGIAPARICAVSTVATPRKMNTPKPPPPIAAAMVAVPTVVTVATRMPAIIVRAAKGNCTCRRSWPPVMPMAIADSQTAGSTDAMPTKVLRRIGRRA